MGHASLPQSSQKGFKPSGQPLCSPFPSSQDVGEWLVGENPLIHGVPTHRCLCSVQDAPRWLTAGSELPPREQLPQARQRIFTNSQVMTEWAEIGRESPQSPPAPRHLCWSHRHQLHVSTEVLGAELPRCGRAGISSKQQED